MKSEGAVRHGREPARAAAPVAGFSGQPARHAVRERLVGVRAQELDLTPEPKIGIALSGGGARAIAFHLGCLRALDRAGLLARARVISTVSGGSVIGALYSLHDGDFAAFEVRVRQVLGRGLVRPALSAAVSWEGLKAAACGALLLAAAVVGAPTRLLATLGSGRTTASGPRLRRFASRTTIFQRGVDHALFRGAALPATERRDRPRWIALATELRTGSAFYFSASHVGSWRFGRLAPAAVTVAKAVTASAAFPLFLPALDEVHAFEQADGSKRTERVSLSDGGIYDNLGLAPFWPDRDPRVSLDVEPVDTIIACRAGDGLRTAVPHLFLLGRMAATVAAMHDRAQNATMKRLFDLRGDGRLARFALAYLGQDDSRLACAPQNLVPRAGVINYPTNFSPMPPEWVERLALRGEQVMLAVLQEHNPDLLPPDLRPDRG